MNLRKPKTARGARSARASEATDRAQALTSKQEGESPKARHTVIARMTPRGLAISMAAATAVLAGLTSATPALASHTTPASLATASAPAVPATGGTWNITPADTSFSASLVTGSEATLTDPDSALDPAITCESSTATGTTGSSPQTPTGDAIVATNVSLNFIDCTDELSDSWTVQNPVPVGELTGASYDPSGTGVVTGGAQDVGPASLSGTILGASCSFVVSGEIADGDVTFTNPTGPLTVSDSVDPQGLTLSSVSGTGCDLADISDGDHVVFEGKYTVTDPSGGVTVTDP